LRGTDGFSNLRSHSDFSSPAPPDSRLRDLVILKFGPADFLASFPLGPDPAALGVLVAGLHLWRLSLVDHQLGRGRVLTHAGAAHITGVGEPRVQDDELVNALVEPLDLDAVILGDDLAGDAPLGQCLVVAHLALEDDLLLLLAGLALQLLEELVLRDNPEDALRLVLVGNLQRKGLNVGVRGNLYVASLPLLLAYQLSADWPVRWPKEGGRGKVFPKIPAAEPESGHPKDNKL